MIQFSYRKRGHIFLPISIFNINKTQKFLCCSCLHPYSALCKKPLSCKKVENIIVLVLRKRNFSVYAKNRGSNNGKVEVDFVEWIEILVRLRNIMMN